MNFVRNIKHVSNKNAGRIRIAKRIRINNGPNYYALEVQGKANQPICVANIVKRNIKNAVRVHSTMGGSTNIMMHLISCMIYSGVRFSIHEYDRIRRRVRIPDLMDYSLTQGRDIFALAQQCQAGKIRGIETVLYELRRNGVAIDEDAPIMAGQTWGRRLHNVKYPKWKRIKRSQNLCLELPSDYIRWFNQGLTAMRSCPCHPSDVVWVL